MPKRRTSYLLTETAARDFRVARYWSLSRWGRTQTQTYFRRLHDAAEYIAANQTAIQERRELTGDSELGIYPVGEHYLVYCPLNESQIAIIALIRQTRDVPAILQANRLRISRALTSALDARS